MHILLLNTNPVVSRLIALCIREEHVTLEEVTSLNDVQHARYDLLFVDDASYSEDVDAFLTRVQVGERVLLAGKSMSDGVPECFGSVLKKPFLPSQITEILKEAERRSQESREEESHFIFPLSSRDEEESDTEAEAETSESEMPEEPLSLFEEVHEQEEVSLTEVAEEGQEDPAEDTEEEEQPLPNVLDNSEIEKIKALLDASEEEEEEESVKENEALDLEARKIEVITEHLEADGLEIVSEDEMIDLLSQIPKPDEAAEVLKPNDPLPEKEKKKEKKRSKKREKAKKSKKKSNDKKQSAEEEVPFEEALLSAIEGMKIKKLKKLLKNADISIQISFKDK